MFNEDLLIEDFKELNKNLTKILHVFQILKDKKRQDFFYRLNIIVKNEIETIENFEELHKQFIEELQEN